mmetsp:Transcript_5054/g.7546  ORF Transcript_5054/g.7546 Transcript_5054/m.7546 type:complete len:229 (-) Transcript_5054:36-722(-)
MLSFPPTTSPPSIPIPPPTASSTSPPTTAPPSLPNLPVLSPPPTTTTSTTPRGETSLRFEDVPPSSSSSASSSSDLTAQKRATWLLADLKDKFLEVPGADRTGQKIALRMTRGPTSACINFHCDGSYASATVQVALNDPSQYTGGRLCFFLHDYVHIPQRPAGSMTQHPAKVLHGVTSLIEGTRKSLFVVDENNGLGEGSVVVVDDKLVENFLSLLEGEDYVKGESSK